MGRFVLIVGAVMVGYGVFTPDLIDLEPLRDKYWLVAVFPAVYMLGVALLGD